MRDPRIELLPAGDAHPAAEQAGVPAMMADLNVFRVLLHHPRVARAVNDLLSSLLFDAELDTRLRELVIMRIGWLTRSDYEWTQHWRVARLLGVDEEDLLAVREGPGNPRFGAAESAVLTATDETVKDGRVSAATWDACAHALGGDTQKMIELVAVIGTWRMISSILQSLEVPLEVGVGSWPPDGRTP